MGKPHQPNPINVREAASAAELLSSGALTLDEAVELLGSREFADGLLGLSHILIAYLIQAGRDPASIWPAVRNLADRAAAS